MELKEPERGGLRRILKEPRNAFLGQYQALVETEGASIEFTDEGAAEIARIASELNDAHPENIGARRLQTVMTDAPGKELMFGLPEVGNEPLGRFDKEFARATTKKVAEDEDLRRYTTSSEPATPPTTHRTTFRGM